MCMEAVGHGLLHCTLCYDMPLSYIKGFMKTLECVLETARHKTIAVYESLAEVLFSTGGKMSPPCIYDVLH